MYYRKKNRRKMSKVKKVILISTIIVISGFISFIYYFSSIVTPTAMLIADSEMRARALDIINENIAYVYANKFNYDELITVEKDANGKITMLKSDTVRLNALATEVALKSQEDIREFGSIGVKMPLGYITKNSILSYWGPSITIRMEPIGRVEISYDSTFESAGINQTRHKIYINVKTNLNIILPVQSREVELKSEIPVAETIIVGEIPRTALGVDFLRQ